MRIAHQVATATIHIDVCARLIQVVVTRIASKGYMLFVVATVAVITVASTARASAAVPLRIPYYWSSLRALAKSSSFIE